MNTAWAHNDAISRSQFICSSTWKQSLSLPLSVLLLSLIKISLLPRTKKKKKLRAVSFVYPIVPENAQLLNGIQIDKARVKFRYLQSFAYCFAQRVVWLC